MSSKSKTPELTTRQKLLAKAGRQYRDVIVADVGNVRVRNLTAREQIEVANSLPDKANNLEGMVAYIMACVVNEDGAPLFEEGDRQQVEDLNCAVMAQLFSEIRELCGLDIGVKDQAKN